MRAYVARVLVLVLLVAGATGCFAITDLDRFTRGTGGGGERRDATFSLCGFAPHLTHVFEVRILTGNVDAPAPRLLGRAVFAPLAALDTEVVMPGVLPAEGDVHLDFYADNDGDMAIDPPPPGGTDHQWRFDLPASEPFVYTHDTDFRAIASPEPVQPPGTFRLSVTNADAHVFPVPMTRVLEVRVIRYVGTDPVVTVGLARFAILGANFEVVIPNVLEDELYRVEYFVDINRDGQLQLRTEPSWRQDPTETGAGGLTLEASLSTDEMVELALPAPPSACSRL